MVRSHLIFASVTFWLGRERPSSLQTATKTSQLPYKPLRVKGCENIMPQLRICGKSVLTLSSLAQVSRIIILALVAVFFTASVHAAQSGLCCVFGFGFFCVKP
jgi:hypothetical protein